MNNEIPHVDNFAPRCLGTSLTKILGKHIGSLSDDNKLINNGKVAHLVTFDLLKSFAFCKLIDIVDTLKDMLKPSLIFNRLSHKSILCLYLPFPLQKVITYLL